MSPKLPFVSIVFIALLLSSCSSGLFLSQQNQKAESEGAMAYQPIEQPVPEVEMEEPSATVDNKSQGTKKSNFAKVAGRVKDFTKNVVASSFNKLQPKSNTASSQKSSDITTGQILVILLIVLLVGLLFGIPGIGDIVRLLVGVLVVILLILLILWLLEAV